MSDTRAPAASTGASAVLRYGRIKPKLNVRGDPVRSDVSHLTAVARHNTRSAALEIIAQRGRAYKDIDPERVRHNITLKAPGDGSHAAIVAAYYERVKQAGVTKRYRKTGVVAVEVLVSLRSFHHPRLRKYFANALRFLEREHGEANVICAHVHLDQARPHMHVVIVPVHGSGKYLNADGMVGNKETVRERRERFVREVAEPHAALPAGRKAARSFTDIMISTGAGPKRHEEAAKRDAMLSRLDWAHVVAAPLNELGASRRASAKTARPMLCHTSCHTRAGVMRAKRGKARAGNLTTHSRGHRPFGTPSGRPLLPPQSCMRCDLEPLPGRPTALSARGGYCPGDTKQARAPPGLAAATYCPTTLSLPESNEQCCSLTTSTVSAQSTKKPLAASSRGTSPRSISAAPVATALTTACTMRSGARGPPRSSAAA